MPHSSVQGSLLTATKYVSLGLSLSSGLHHVGVAGVHLTHLDAQKQGHIFLKAIQLSGWRLEASCSGSQGKAEGMGTAA